MNKFFYFLAVLCLFTLGSCEKDVKPDIDAGGGGKGTFTFGGGEILLGDKDGPDGPNSGGGGTNYCVWQQSMASRVFLGSDECPGDADYPQVLTCVINPNYYPSSYTPPAGTIPDYDYFIFIGTTWTITGAADDAIVGTQFNPLIIHSGVTSSGELEMKSTFDFSSNSMYNYDFTVSSDFWHQGTGDVIRYTTTHCASSNPDTCNPFVITGGNGGPGGLTIIAYQPATDTEEGPP